MTLDHACDRSQPLFARRSTEQVAGDRVLMDGKYCAKCKTALIRCGECNGTGKVGGMRCTRCKGTKYLCHVHGGNWT